MNLPSNYAKALALKQSDRGVTMPDLAGWNTDLPLRAFQKKGVAWLYLVRRGLLADATGLGKTQQALGLLSLLKTLGKPHRAVVLVQNYQTQVQWHREIKRFTDFRPTVIDGTKSERVSQYGGWWDIMINRYSLLLRDLPYLRELSFDVLILDEASTARNHDIKTARFVKTLSNNADRVVLLDATPIQTSLLDIHSILEILRMNVFGPQLAFELRYVRRERVKERRGNKMITSNKIIGYRNMREFKERIDPFILRRRVSDVEVEMPDVQVQDAWLDLGAAQRQRYNQVRRGILDFYRGGNRVKGRAHFHHLQMACDTLQAFDPDSDISVKLDYLMNLLLRDLRGEKVIIFSKYKAGVRHIIQRMARSGLQALPFTGDVDSVLRTDYLSKFWDDTETTALVGTSALERGLNLQRSAYMICFDQMWNPQRQEQLLGRIRRIGSEHSKVYMINLLTTDTIEEKLQRLLRERAALPGYVFDEQSDIFDALSDDELVMLLQE